MGGRVSCTQAAGRAERPDPAGGREPDDWTGRIRLHLSDVATHYETSAPTVSDWANRLYIRMNEEYDDVRLSELYTAENLRDADGWVHPNVAANTVYKLMSRLGQNVVGHAGF